MFWKWKYQSILTEKSTIKLISQPTIYDDPELQELMSKYKLFNQVERFQFDNCDIDENCDAEDDEITISNQKKSQFEKPVHTAGLSFGNKK